MATNTISEDYGPTLARVSPYARAMEPMGRIHARLKGQGVESTEIEGVCAGNVRVAPIPATYQSSSKQHDGQAVTAGS
jgi:hypothetical protein